MPMTTSDSNEVPKLRRKDRCPSPVQISSSIWDSRSSQYRRRKYQLMPRRGRRCSSEATRRTSEARFDRRLQLPGVIAEGQALDPEEDAHQPIAD